MNEVVEREKLMKEIWEDQGLVVISRNVDVLVSKLRKKLMDDPSIKIINVPGKGYKCMIG
jgi:DNA-binding winged helix-turn-helix (wHTH) protein